MGIYDIFLPILNIFIHISTYFHVYFYIFSCIFLLISTYLPQKCGILPQIATKVCCFTTDCHKSVVFYNRLPQKCVVFTTDCHKSVVFYHSLPQKCGIRCTLKCTLKCSIFDNCTLSTLH